MQRKEWLPPDAINALLDIHRRLLLRARAPILNGERIVYSDPEDRVDSSQSELYSSQTLGLLEWIKPRLGASAFKTPFEITSIRRMKLLDFPTTQYD